MKSESLHPEINKVIDFKVLKITSPAFEEESNIPTKYTCEGEDVSPPLSIELIPEEAKSLAIIMDDPDAPSGIWAHWIVWNIPVTHFIKENEIHGQQGKNDFRKQRYNGPCPPRGIHRYFFKIYALDCLLKLDANSGKNDLERAMASHILAFGELIGTYSRSDRNH
ncbi:MAG TPA: YbhB/YbcL family Raf kinase inhibitor-like protein [Flavisolibacter sp.]|nr:YbhB/YbcL family Raf kinase inhibitor-like protein [Flavisolibacter sp.]